MANDRARNPVYLTPEQLSLAKRLLKKAKRPSLREIAELVGCSHNTIHRIDKGVTYRDVK